MFTLQDFNLIMGLGWEEQWEAKIHITFHEQDGGFSEEITASCNRWFYRMRLPGAIRTAHLPSTLSFNLSDLRRLNNGYKNVSAILPLEFHAKGLEVLNGPARGTKIPAS